MTKNDTRVESIDYLRGIMAVCVVLYHFNSWTINTVDAGNILGKLGIYAVSIFFIISGISMHLAYKKFSWDSQGVFNFIKKRYLRLFPAFFTACVLVKLFHWVIGDSYSVSIETFLLNVTFLFAFLLPGSYIPTGGWSIGCEIIFYTLFPLIIFFKNKGIIIALALSFFAFVYYSFFEMLPATSLGDRWATYIQPFNQLFFFVSGIAISAFSHGHKIYNRLTWLIFFAATLAFCLYPSSGNLISIVTGSGRLALTFISIMLCISFFHLEINFRINKILKFFGDLSYGIYIFHGIISEVFLFTLTHLGIIDTTDRLLLLLFVNLPIIIIFSYFFYQYIEVKCMRASRVTYSVSTENTSLSRD